MQVFLFFKRFVGNFNKEDTRVQQHKNSRDLHITANVPLLNLNLNYEKLRHKDNKFYQIINLRQTESLHI